MRGAIWCLKHAKWRLNLLAVSCSDVALDGNLTLTENLADHGGLKMALSAYSTWRSTNQDSRLPALPFTDLQLFFLGGSRPKTSTFFNFYKITLYLTDSDLSSYVFFLDKGYALPWCSTDTDFHTKTTMMKDEHSPGRYSNYLTI